MSTKLSFAVFVWARHVLAVKFTWRRARKNAEGRWKLRGRHPCLPGRDPPEACFRMGLAGGDSGPLTPG
jgi:hypothetical protein